MFGTSVHISVPLPAGHNNPDHDVSHNNPDRDVSKSRIVDLRMVNCFLKLFP